MLNILKKIKRKLISLSNLYLNLSNIPKYKKSFFPKIYKEVLPASKLEIKGAKTTSTPSKFMKIGEILYDSIYICELENARVWGTQGTVITKENILFSDVSREFEVDGNNISIFKQRKLVAPTFYNSNVAVIATSGAEVYYHWLLDVVPRIILIKNHCSTPIDFWILNYSKLPFQDEILNLLDIPLDKIITSNNHWNFHAIVSKLIVPSLVSPNNSPSKWAIDNVKNLYKSDISSLSKEKIYLQRSIGRHIINEKEVLDILLPLGFKVLNPEDYTVAEQSKIFSSAGFIISAHGSALANIIFCEKDTKVIDIFAPEWINPCYSVICAIKDLKYGYLIGKIKKEKRKINKSANILVEIKELELLIEELESSI